MVPQAKIGGLLLVQDQPGLQNETHLKQNKENPNSQDRYFFKWYILSTEREIEACFKGRLI